jgi:hypothetical protein
MIFTTTFMIFTATFMIFTAPLVVQGFKVSMKFIGEKVVFLIKHLYLYTKMICLNFNNETLFFELRDRGFLYYAIGLSFIIFWVKFGDFVPTQ